MPLVALARLRGQLWGFRRACRSELFGFGVDAGIRVGKLPCVPGCGEGVEAAGSEQTGDADLKRAGDPTSRRSYVDAALDAAAESGIGFS